MIRALKERLVRAYRTRDAERVLAMQLTERLAAQRQFTDRAYEERNRLVALLARIYPSGIRKTAIEGWEPEWHNCVFIDTPDGQLSWHYHDREADLFRSLPEYTKPWDGHTTEQKYARVDALVTRFWRHGWDPKQHHLRTWREPVVGDLVPQRGSPHPLVVTRVERYDPYGKYRRRVANGLKGRYLVNDEGINPFGPLWEPAPIESGWERVDDEDVFRRAPPEI